ncbi:hypothetical protein OB2597_02317 [Pseudooceanicola batsensis HTCC2597]|uniref:ATP-dependent transcriptional regulator n=1 Tax=Pseudooceanicola batsensis (strain ATCC BAA-863 / DSM 15984 / KCTC 12145 / HTCC2597) TaxID=252305 RepID=A3TX57_PSEBH|nr:DUF2927 domain-containing protein [Pseudooceanicola batsensis]EAQ03417.1 hypothetical protein OB2597_02317 [Pseudooceanicola batsensis HTCC2597]
MRLRSVLRFAPMVLALSACFGPMDAPKSGLRLSDETPTRLAQASLPTLPPMKVFAAPRPSAPTRSNIAIARDILDLSFRLESGRDLPAFTRFEGPIRVAVTGQPAPGMTEDLRRLLARLRSEARIDIDFGRGPNQIIVQAVPGREIRKHLPQAACFVVPGITDLGQYHAARRRGDTDWAQLRVRETIAVIVPNDVSPQESRDCLHEELAQALGPLNDLYRLPDSTFNDDNMNTVLTGFDMLVLRATYAPELRSGMRRDQVARALPGVLARLNPQGNGRAARFLPDTPTDWIESIQSALGPRGTVAGRSAAANRALMIARNSGWQDHRLAFSHFTVARLIQSYDREAAYAHLTRALRLYRARPETATHAAHVAAQLAAHAIHGGDGTRALALLEGQDAVAHQSENAALLASIQMLRAEALELTGQDGAAGSVRLDSLGWARYGFGPDWAVRAKLNEIAALRPASVRG